MAAAAGPRSAGQILLYVPNLIGYLRCALLAAGFVWAKDVSPVLFCVLYAAQAALDALDGVAARRLNQCSAFGAWFDVVIDNVGRAWLWTLVHPNCVLVGCLEWVTFVCTHASSGAEWRTNYGPAPALVNKVMQKGFKTPFGVAALAGVHVLPIWLYFAPAFHFSWPVVAAGACVLLCCRLLALAVELYFISTYVGRLLSQDVRKAADVAKVK